MKSDTWLRISRLELQEPMTICLTSTWPRRLMQLQGGQAEFCARRPKRKASLSTSVPTFSICKMTTALQRTKAVNKVSLKKSKRHTKQITCRLTRTPNQQKTISTLSSLIRGGTRQKSQTSARSWCTRWVLRGVPSLCAPKAQTNQTNQCRKWISRTRRSPRIETASNLRLPRQPAQPKKKVPTASARQRTRRIWA